ASILASPCVPLSFIRAARHSSAKWCSGAKQNCIHRSAPVQMHEKQASWFKVSFVMAHEPELQVLFSRTQIAERVASLATTISRDFANEHVVLIGVLKGAAIFMSDLARALTIDATFDFVGVASYG